MTAKEKALEIFTRIKAVFDTPAPTPPAPPAPAASATPPPGGMTSCSYPVDNGGPVYVDISDDGLPDIDANDKAYTDSAMTIPYPDGTYTVTGTQFGFTVAAGVISAVTDPAGTGPGTPIEDPAAMAKPPAPAPAPAPVPTAQPVTLTAEEVQAMYAKFATGTPEDRIANLETMVKALMESNFGYQIRQGQENSAIQVYKDSLTNTQAQVATAVTQLQAASDKLEAQNVLITKHEETIKGLFELVEKLVELPTVDPVTLNGRKKEQFDRQSAKEKKFEGIAAAMKEMKKQNN